MLPLKVGICPNLTDSVVTTLKSHGVRIVVDFVCKNLEELSRATSISYKELVLIRRVLLAQYTPFPINGENLYDDVISTVSILSAGCPSIDNLLEGGLYTGEITEVFGPPACGKTQLCLSAVLAVASESEQHAIYFDTGGSFDIERVQNIIDQKVETEQEMKSICSRISWVPTFDIFELLSEIENLRNLLNKKTDEFYTKVKLVVVDCVASVISPILGGHQVDGLPSHYSLLTLPITNNLVHDFHSGEARPSLGKTWSHVPNTRIELQRPVEGAVAMSSHSAMRKAVLVKSTKQDVNKEVEFKITDRGLEIIS